MANKPLKSIKFPGLSDTYTVPEVDATLATTGAAADAKKVGDEISDIKADLSEISEYVGQGTIVQLELATLSRTSHGVTFTQNSDETVTVSGTNDHTGAITYGLRSASAEITISLTAGEKYRLSGCPTGGGNETYNMSLRYASGGAALFEDNGSGVICTIPETTTYKILIRVAFGYSGNKVFTPKLEKLTDVNLSAKDTVARDRLDRLTVTADMVFTDGYVQKDYSDERVKLTGTETTGYLWNTTSGVQESNANGRYVRFNDIGNYSKLYIDGSSVDAYHRSYAIYDANNNRLSVQSGSLANGFVSEPVKVPNGASYIIVNSLNVSATDGTGRNISIACYALKPGESEIVNDMSTLNGTETTGYAWRINGTPLQNSAYKYVRYNTIPESKFIYIKGMTYLSTCPLISFYNASDELIAYRYGGNAATYFTRVEVSIPSGTAYFIVNVQNGSTIPPVVYPEASGERETQADVNKTFEEALSDLSERIERKSNNYLQYVNDSNGENICIWISSGNNHYIKYVFEHAIVSSINSNVWRIATASLCDSNFNDIVTLTVSGEWECALRLENRSDFCGGRIHGDEIYSDITFIVDGTVVSNIATYTNRTLFEELKILQTSALYDPDNQSDKIADHMSEHVFSANSKNQCTIKQSVLWDGSYNIATCFLAMFPISKDVSDKWYNNFTFKLDQIEFGKYRNVTEIAMNGYNDKIWSRFGINKYVDADYTGNGDFKLTDNSGLAYNKCYYTICGGPGGREKTGEVVSGDVWQSESFYNFEYVE